MNGRNPLHYAADYGHADMLEYLLSKGAKIDVSARERVWWVTGWIESEREVEEKEGAVPYLMFLYIVLFTFPACF